MDLSGVFCVADSGVLQDTILWNSVGMHTCSVWFSNNDKTRVKSSFFQARRQGALADEIEIHGRWKPQGRQVAFRYIDVKQLYIDAKVAGMLCNGGPIKCKLKVGLEN